MNSSYVLWMNEAISLAESSMIHGNHPFGALLVLDDRVIARAENTVVSECDVTRHAELNLLQQYLPVLSVSERARTILVCSTEPCAMCAGAIYWSGIRRVVFGCSAGTLARYAGDSIEISGRRIFESASEKTELTGPLLESDAARIHSAYWRSVSACSL